MGKEGKRAVGFQGEERGEERNHHVGKPKARAVVITKEKRDTLRRFTSPLGNSPMHDLGPFFCDL